MEVTCTERGWPAHYICAARCTFRRNTLLVAGDQRIIVSTVGNFRPLDHGRGPAEMVNADGYYETRAFRAVFGDFGYVEADISKPVYFESQWNIASNPDVDRRADRNANVMHDTVVYELTKKLSQGELTAEDAPRRARDTWDTIVQVLGAKGADVLNPWIRHDMGAMADDARKAKEALAEAAQRKFMAMPVKARVELLVTIVIDRLQDAPDLAEAGAYEAGRFGLPVPEVLRAHPRLVAAYEHAGRDAELEVASGDAAELVRHSM